MIFSDIGGKEEKIIMSIIKRKIPVEQLVWSAGALKSRQLPLAVMGGLMLQVDANYDNGAGTTTPEDFWRNLIKRIEIVLNGQDVLCNIPFEFLLHMNTLEFKVAPLTSVDVSASSTVAAYGHFYLPFELLNAVVPRDTLLDARKLSTCVLNVYFGAAGDLTNIDTINSCTVKLVTKEFANIGAEFKKARHEYAYDTINLDVAGAIRYQLPTRGNNQYRRIFVLALDGSTPAILSNSEITNLKVAARSFTYYDKSESQNRADQYKMFNRAALAGIYVIDFTDSGKMAGRIDATEMPELTLELTSSVTDGQAIIISEKAIYGAKSV